jgi:hypothetical protein
MKFLASLFSFLILNSALVLAQDTVGGRDLIWERAAYGSVPGVTHVVIQGVNHAIAATFEDASPESTAIAIPVAALTTPYCASTDADDDAADTGALTLSVTVVTTDYVEVTETLATDGIASSALLTASVLGFNDLRVATAGSTGGNEGVIDCGVGTNTAGSAATAYVTLGVFSATAVPALGAGSANVAQVFQYIVPANHKLVCQNVSVGSVFATQASGITAVIDGSTNLGLLKRFWMKSFAQAGLPVNSKELLVFPEKTYLKGKLAGPTGSNTGPATMTMECLKIATSADQKVF